VVLAPGSVPAHSPNVPIDGEWVVDADLLYARRSIPKRAIIIGAGVIGVEYASIFGALGVEVTLFDQRMEILEFLDGAILETLRAEMTANGVIFRLGEEVLGVEVTGGMVTARGASGTAIEADMLLYAVGRLGNTADLGLDAIGLEADARGRIAVDEHFQTALPHVYAVGDVIGFPALAASSMEQGRLAARYALGAPYEGVQGPLPIGIYAVPELSMVGMTEEQLMRAEVPYVVGLGRYAETARGQIVGDSRGRLKLLVHAETHELLGVHIIGEEATELVHIGQTVIGLGGRLEYLVDNVFNYPTLAETYKIAALDAFNKLTDAER
jgi:NAD(P) transhydrogenase